MENNVVKELSLPLHSAKGWLKFLGILSIIYGVLTALSIVGIIIAWLPIWMGVLLFQSATALEEAFVNGEQEALARALDKLKVYFIIMGVVTLISIAFFVLAMFLGIGTAIMAGMAGAM